jgi:hypothetical protein
VDDIPIVVTAKKKSKSKPKKSTFKSGVRTPNIKALFTRRKSSQEASLNRAAREK